jgi:hypothetical protein
LNTVIIKCICNAKKQVVMLHSLCSMSIDSTSFADVSDVALRMCDVELRVFDGEQSVLRTGVRKAQLLYPRYWVTYLGYRPDLYLIPCCGIGLMIMV